MTDKTAALREEIRAALESLARLASLRPELSVSIGSPGTGWCISMASGRISVDERDLLGRPAEFLAAITLHECAHSTLTRLHRIVPEQIHDNPVEFALINAIEDGRIETWLTDWLPGTREWLIQTQRTLVAEVHGRNPGAIGKNAALDFCLGLILRRHGLPSPSPLHPAAIEALAEVGGAIEEYFELFPRFDLIAQSHAQISADYAASCLQGCFVADDRGIQPEPREMSVRLAQHRAWRILHERIRPVYLRLVSMDPDAKKILALHQLFQRLDWEQNLLPRAEERELIKQFRDFERRVRRRNARRGATRESSNPQVGTGRLYVQARSDYSAVINRLSDSMLHLQRTHGRLKWSRGHAHGHEPDLRVAMEFAATGRNHERMWRRRHLPHRIAPGLVLVADRSSSMRGACAEASFAAAVILNEVCRRVQLPLAVLCYNDSVSSLLAFNDNGATSEAAKRFETILDAAGGTSVVPALDKADEVIARSPHREHLVIVTADGKFDSDERPAFDRITRRWHRSSVRAAGLGLGPQTAGIADWFPGARANLKPADLCSEVTRIVSSFMSDLYRLPAAA